MALLRSKKIENNQFMPKIHKELFALFLAFLLIHPFFSQNSINIIPQPRRIMIGGGYFELNESTKIYCNTHALADATWFANWLSNATKKTFTPIVGEISGDSKNVIWITCGQNINESSEKFESLPENIKKSISNRPLEDYKLVISEHVLMVQAPTAAGVFYGLQSLRQILPPLYESGKVSLPISLECIVIDDSPRFQHRGLLLDCCRHFMSKEFVLRYLDLLALHKMNVLHWHLTEDQGWRIEIKKYPELTKTGAWRTEADGSRYGGYYTQEDIKEIVAYAQSLHITIIPEIEMPGHSVAAIAAYPHLSCTGDTIPVETEWGVFKDIYCAGQETTFEFLEDVLDEVCELFPSPYIHIGGDESPRFRWENCDKCQKRMRVENLKSEAELQSWFNERVANYLKSKNKIIIGWDEILEGGIPSTAVIQSWRGMEGGEHAALSGHKAVMSPTSHCYFDYPIEKIDLQKVYSFNPIPPSLETKDANLIIGGECNMWSEHTPQEVVDQYLFPRILALCEVLWTYPDSPDFNEFYSRVDNHLNRLDILGVNYGFPSYPAAFSFVFDPVKQSISANLLESMKDVQLSYRLMQSDKQIGDWKIWSGPIDMTTDLRIESKAKWRGRDFEPKMSRDISIHKGLGHKPILSYTPSPYYTGGGNNALADGVLGGNNFRNGLWQAVLGEDMEITFDLEKETSIQEISSNWYHYANAWIFRPKALEFYISHDGEKWEKIAKVESQIPDTDSEEKSITFNSGEINVHTRFIKVRAINNGPCPKWHDAPGEPSWLFCDEIIIR
jgi:hexosaminidase